MKVITQSSSVLFISFIVVLIETTFMIKSKNFFVVAVIGDEQQDNNNHHHALLVLRREQQDQQEQEPELDQRDQQTKRRNLLGGFGGLFNNYINHEEYTAKMEPVNNNSSIQGRHYIDGSSSSRGYYSTNYYGGKKAGGYYGGKKGGDYYGAKKGGKKAGKKDGYCPVEWGGKKGGKKNGSSYYAGVGQKKGGKKGFDIFYPNPKACKVTLGRCGPICKGGSEYYSNYYTGKKSGKKGYSYYGGKKSGSYYYYNNGREDTTTASYARQPVCDPQTIPEWIQQAGDCCCVGGASYLKVLFNTDSFVGNDKNITGTFAVDVTPPNCSNNPNEFVNYYYFGGKKSKGNKGKGKGKGKGSYYDGKKSGYYEGKKGGYYEGKKGYGYYEGDYYATTKRGDYYSPSKSVSVRTESLDTNIEINRADSNEVYLVRCDDKCLTEPLSGKACSSISKTQPDIKNGDEICIASVNPITQIPNFAKRLPPTLRTYFFSDPTTADPDDSIVYKTIIETCCSKPLVKPWGVILVEACTTRPRQKPINLSTTNTTNIVLAFQGGISTGYYEVAKKLGNENEAGFEMGNCGCDCSPSSKPSSLPSALPSPAPSSPNRTPIPTIRPSGDINLPTPGPSSPPSTSPPSLPTTSTVPSKQPSELPSEVPSSTPPTPERSPPDSFPPSVVPPFMISPEPSSPPSAITSEIPSEIPSEDPTFFPTTSSPPSTTSEVPTEVPSEQPSEEPTRKFRSPAPSPAPNADIIVTPAPTPRHSSCSPSMDARTAPPTVNPTQDGNTPHVSCLPTPAPTSKHISCSPSMDSRTATPTVNPTQDGNTPHVSCSPTTAEPHISCNPSMSTEKPTAEPTIASISEARLEIISNGDTNTCGLADAPSSMLEYLCRMGNFSLVCSAIGKSNLNAIFGGISADTILTMYAPINEAMEKCGMNETMIDSINASKLRDFIRAHVTAGAIQYNDMVCGTQQSTLLGDASMTKIGCTYGNDSVKTINGFFNGQIKPTILTPNNIDMCNGVVHPIDYCIMVLSPMKSLSLGINRIPGEK